MGSKEGEAARFEGLRMRVFYIMGNHRLSRIKCFHTLGTPESERLKVTALNPFHLTASPTLKKLVLSYDDTALKEKEEG